ncbi:hypothetical protein SRABI04_02313 [Chryseobacterium sp. Bi04]|nr:hypothetical protein SRABI04_02313 [Chryseobacterium sp. Bi04]
MLELLFVGVFGFSQQGVLLMILYIFTIIIVKMINFNIKLFLFRKIINNFAL